MQKELISGAMPDGNLAKVLMKSSK